LYALITTARGNAFDSADYVRWAQPDYDEELQKENAMYANIRGRRIHYLVEGEGLTCIVYRAFEKSGHFSHFEDRALFDSTLLEWLKLN
jgi:hypothetical protein